MSLRLNTIRPVMRFLDALPRGFALFLGGFTLLNLVGERFIRGFDVTIWWLDLYMIPAGLQDVFLGLFALTMLLFGLETRSADSPFFRKVVGILAIAASAIGTANAIEFFRLAEKGEITPGLPLPLSLFIAAGLAGIGIAALRSQSGEASLPSGSPILHLRRFDALAVATLIALSFPLSLVLFFGSTDYRRPADIAVVFGAKAFADGGVSAPLADRVDRACELYRKGIVRRLLFSGGPGEGTVHETEAMRTRAIGLGVDSTDILLDRDGINTEHTVANSVRIADSLRAGRLIAVSHPYHLPRIKMTFKRYGHNVYTIPADDRSRHGEQPGQLAREIVAFWAYYLRPFSGSV